MGNQAFEIPCADRKTREKNLLNKYDRTKIYEENKDKPPRSQRVLNGVENVIHNHERKTTKNSAFIERNLKPEQRKSTNASERNTKEEFLKNYATEPLALTTLDSNELDSMKVDFLSKPSIINELNKVLFAEKVDFFNFFREIMSFFLILGQFFAYFRLSQSNGQVSDHNNIPIGC